TIEDILGAQHMNLNTAFQRPMTDVFDTRSSGKWNFVAEASTVLKVTQLAEAPGGLGVKFARGGGGQPKDGREDWGKATAGFDFSDADRVPPDKFNRVLWKGLMGGRRYPALTGRQATDDRDN